MPVSDSIASVPNVSFLPGVRALHGGYGAAPAGTSAANDELAFAVRSLAHDLRAQLMLVESSFRAFARRIDDRAANVEQHQVEACLAQSRHLLSDLLALAETGELAAQAEWIDTAEVIGRIADQWVAAFAERGYALHVEERLLPRLKIHRRRLEQIVSNLIANALRHGCRAPGDCVEIVGFRGVKPAAAAESEAERIRKTKAGVEFRIDAPPITTVGFCVRDFGPGIAPADRERIFLSGERLATAHEEGHGLGLAIVRKWVTHYGGAIYVDPDYALGASFVVSFPM